MLHRIKLFSRVYQDAVMVTVEILLVIVRYFSVVQHVKRCHKMLKALQSAKRCQKGVPWRYTMLWGDAGTTRCFKVILSAIVFWKLLKIWNFAYSQQIVYCVFVYLSRHVLKTIFKHAYTYNCVFEHM